MEHKIVIEGKGYKLRASALIPRLYRAKFGTDLITDLQKCKVDDLNIEPLENLTWLLIRHADNTQVPDSVEEWLDNLSDIGSIIEALPEVLQYWAESNKTTSVSRKKAR